MANNLRDVQLKVMPTQPQQAIAGQQFAQAPGGWQQQLQVGPPAAHLQIQPAQLQQLQLMHQMGYGGSPYGQMLPNQQAQNIQPAFNQLAGGNGFWPAIQGPGMQAGNPQLGMDTTGVTFMAPQPLQGGVDSINGGGAQMQGNNMGMPATPAAWNPYWDY